MTDPQGPAADPIDEPSTGDAPEQPDASAPAVGRRPTAPALVVAPLVVALLVAGWLLWTRQDPARQGGYCANATIEVTRVLEATVDQGAGATTPVAEVLDRVGDVDVTRFQVDTPADVRADVALVARTHDKTAFARILADYLDRCGEPD